MDSIVINVDTASSKCGANVSNFFRDYVTELDKKCGDSPNTRWVLNTTYVGKKNADPTVYNELNLTSENFRDCNGICTFDMKLDLKKLIPEEDTEPNTEKDPNKPMPYVFSMSIDSNSKELAITMMDNIHHSLVGNNDYIESSIILAEADGPTAEIPRIQLTVLKDVFLQDVPVIDVSAIKYYAMKG
jgi:hypothetical protein